MAAAVLATAAAWAAPARISLQRLRGPVYLAIDPHFDTTNSLVYVGPRSVTVVGATWTPRTARELAARIGRVTSRPITAVIDTSPDPEWSGGNAYWKGLGAKIYAVKATDDVLVGTWGERNRPARRNHPGYPILPLGTGRV
jgi:metallo-beta-lactamase class B